MMKIFQTLILILLIASCGQNKKGKSTQQIASTDDKVFVVQEVLQTSKYSYLKVSENNTERWVAVTKVEAIAGDRYYYDKVHQMKNFHSKELNRDFKSVDFINKISKTPLSQPQPQTTKSPIAPMMSSPGHGGKVKASINKDISVEKAAGELTIAQVFSNPQSYANKEIVIKGKVVKVNKNIMGKNWIHIQDGTSHNNKFDLTFTSSQVPVINQEVSLKGTLVLDKDFGAGYFYDVIVEKAVIVK